MSNEDRRAAKLNQKAWSRDYIEFHCTEQADLDYRELIEEGDEVGQEAWTTYCGFLVG